MRDYKKINAWRLADDLAVALYGCTRSFPREETYGLASQLRRAAASVPANIVEGSSRESQRDSLHFLHIARGSLSESECLLHLARRLGYLTEPEHEVLSRSFRQTFACLHGLIRAVEAECQVRADRNHPPSSAQVEEFQEPDFSSISSTWRDFPESVVSNPVVP